MAKATFSNDVTITLLVETNPKRGASAERFQHYFKAKTVGEFLELGGTRADVIWDQKHDYIQLGVPRTEETEAAVKAATKKVSTKAAKTEDKPTKGKAAKKDESKTEETPKDNAWPFKQTAGTLTKADKAKKVGAKAKAAAKRPSKAKVTKPAAQAAA